MMQASDRIAGQTADVTDATRVLRWVVVLEWALLVAGVPLSIYLEGALPTPLVAEIEAQDQSVEETSFAVWGLVVAIYLVGSIGVFRLWRPARVIYTLVTIAGIGIMPFFGHQIAHAWAVPISEVGTLVSGAALALLWFSPARTHFART